MLVAAPLWRQLERERKKKRSIKGRGKKKAAGSQVNNFLFVSEAARLRGYDRPIDSAPCSIILIGRQISEKGRRAQKRYREGDSPQYLKLWKGLSRLIRNNFVLFFAVGFSRAVQLFVKFHTRFLSPSQSRSRWAGFRAEL